MHKPVRLRMTINLLIIHIYRPIQLKFKNRCNKKQQLLSSHLFLPYKWAIMAHSYIIPISLFQHSYIVPIAFLYPTDIGM